MNFRELILALSLVTAACNGCAPALQLGATIDNPSPTVDVSHVLHLQGQESGASACPVDAAYALTSGHVVMDYEKRAQGMRGYTFSSDSGMEGILKPVTLFEYADLGLVEPGIPFTHFYELSPDKPEEGDLVAFIGFDWRDKKRAFRTRVWETEILYTVAGTIIMKDPGEPGTSGSCVFLLKNGKVVGINRGYLTLDSGETVGTAVGVWGIKVNNNAPTSN